MKILGNIVWLIFGGFGIAVEYFISSLLLMIIDIHFSDTEKSVRSTMHKAKNHPLVPNNIIGRGFIIDSTTRNLTEVSE